MTGLFKEHGRKLVENGYAIIPIPPGTKGPRTEGWQENYASTVESYEDMAKANPRCGVGIITKHTPAIDIDCLDERITAHMRLYCHTNIGPAPERVGKAPKTLLLYVADKPFRKVMSARYYDPAHPERDPKKKGQRLEVLGEGQQFVAYHIHPDTGLPYDWPSDWENPLDVSVFDLTVITQADAEDACREFERLCEEAGWEKLGEGSTSREDGDHDPADALGDLDPPEETEDEVARVKSALDAISGDVASEYDYDQWRNVLFSLKWTRWDCAEALALEWSESSDKHERKQFNVVWKGAQKRDRGREVTLGSLFTMAKKAGWDASRAPSPEKKESIYQEVMALVANIAGPDDRDSIKAVVKRISTESLDSTDEFQVLTAIKKVTKLPLPELRKQVAEFRREVRNAKMKPTHAGYAGRLIEIIEEESGVEPVSCGGSLYIYNEKKGIYEQQTQESIRSLVVNHFDDSELCIRGSDYSAIANLTIGGNDKPNFFDEAPIGLACKGRFYFISKDGTIEKEKLDSDHRQRFLTTVVPVAGETPMFDQFLQETFENNDAVNQIALLQEVFGAILIGYMPKLEKALFLKGPGRSGKSTILKIIRAMFSPDVQCASSPFDWDHEYARASLLGKRLNIVGELPLDKPIPSHDFKTITGRDPINARLPYQPQFTFSPTAAHVFSSNHYIYTSDNSEAFFARFVVIECANSRAFNDSAIITDLADQIIEKELRAIMAWGLQGAKRLLENKGVMTATKTSARMFAEWMRSSSSVMEFMTDEDAVEYGQHKTHAVNRADFYSAYTEWCKESGRRPMSKRRVYDELSTRPFARFMLKMTEGGGRKLLIRGVKLKRDNWVVPMEDDDDEL